MDNKDEYYFPTDEEFEKELAIGNYKMIMLARELGLSDEESLSPSKCLAKIGQVELRCLKDGMDVAMKGGLDD